MYLSSRGVCIQSWGLRSLQCYIYYLQSVCVFPPWESYIFTCFSISLIIFPSSCWQVKLDFGHDLLIFKFHQSMSGSHCIHDQNCRWTLVEDSPWLDEMTYCRYCRICLFFWKDMCFVLVDVDLKDKKNTWKKIWVWFGDWMFIVTGSKACHVNYFTVVYVTHLLNKMSLFQRK